jgi:hypothetical protein
MPEGDWRFLGQLDSFYSFYKTPAIPLRHVTADPHHWEGRTYMAQGPSFGGGVAYVFFREVEGRAEGWMAWQCRWSLLRCAAHAHRRRVSEDSEGALRDRLLHYRAAMT